MIIVFVAMYLAISLMPWRGNYCMSLTRCSRWGFWSQGGGIWHLKWCFIPLSGLVHPRYKWIPKIPRKKNPTHQGYNLLKWDEPPSLTKYRNSGRPNASEHPHWKRTFETLSMAFHEDVPGARCTMLGLYSCRWDCDYRSGNFPGKAMSLGWKLVHHGWLDWIWIMTSRIPSWIISYRGIGCPKRSNMATVLPIPFTVDFPTKNPHCRVNCTAGRMGWWSPQLQGTVTIHPSCGNTE